VIVRVLFVINSLIGGGAEQSLAQESGISGLGS
jgi:hypothetical protein